MLCRLGPKKLKAAGAAYTKRSGAGTLSDARAARALLLGHYFGRLSRVLLFSARPRSVCPARRALIFTGGLRSQRQKAITDLASRSGAPIARTRSDYSWLCGGGFVKASVPTPIGRPTRGRGPNASLWTYFGRLCCHAEGKRQNAASACRRPAYDSTRRLSRRTRPNGTPSAVAKPKPRRFA